MRKARRLSLITWFTVTMSMVCALTIAAAASPIDHRWQSEPLAAAWRPSSSTAASPNLTNVPAAWRGAVQPPQSLGTQSLVILQAWWTAGRSPQTLAAAALLQQQP